MNTVGGSEHTSSITIKQTLGHGLLLPGMSGSLCFLFSNMHNADLYVNDPFKIYKLNGMG